MLKPGPFEAELIEELRDEAAVLDLEDRADPTEVPTALNSVTVGERTTDLLARAPIAGDRVEDAALVVASDRFVETGAY